MQVLATMVEEARAGRPGEVRKVIPAAVWQLISDALAAGAATLSTTAAAAASQPVDLIPFIFGWNVLTVINVPQDTHYCVVGTICHADLA